MATVPNSNNTSSTTNQRFALADNMDNIPKITRMWRAQWPEFSWQTLPGGDYNTRCFQMFAPDISRVGYGAPGNNNQCPIYSVMCPQQGIWIPSIEGTLNIEVTVKNSGGYVTENPMFIDGQITIQPQLWFSPDTMQNNTLIKLLWQLFQNVSIPFPSAKGNNAIKLNGYGVDQKDQPVKSPVLNIQNGMDPNYVAPAFAQHSTPDVDGMVAATVVYLGVEIGEIISSGNAIADEFNQLVMDVFNLASGNLLQYQNVLSWNVWALAPEEVYTPEWEAHAAYWRFSIDVNHRSPEGNGRDPQYANGTAFSPVQAAICTKLKELLNFVVTKLDQEYPNEKVLIDQIAAELDAKINANCGG